MSIMFACFILWWMCPLIIWSLSAELRMSYREAFHISWQEMFCDHSEVGKLTLYLTLNSLELFKLYFILLLKS